MSTTNIQQVNQPPPQQILDISQLSKDLQDAMDEVKEIQQLIIQFIDTIIVRKNDVVEKETQAIKATIKKVHTVKSELDRIAARYSKLRLIQIHPVPLGNAGYVTLDPTEDRNDFYQQLIESYTWLKNLDQDATQLSDMIKEDYISMNQDSSMKKVTLQDICQVLQKEFPSIAFNNTYLSSYSCLQVTVGLNFVVYIFFSGVQLSFVKVKSVNEAIVSELMENSSLHVFQKMTDVFTAEILKISTEDHVTNVKEFMKLVISYKHVFKIKCHVCGKHLAIDSTLKTLIPPLIKQNNLTSGDSFIHFSCHT